MFVCGGVQLGPMRRTAVCVCKCLYACAAACVCKRVRVYSAVCLYKVSVCCPVCVSECGVVGGGLE